MLALAALALQAALSTPAARDPTVALFGVWNSHYGSATVFVGTKVAANHPADEYCGYVPRWNGVAVINGVELGVVSATGYRAVMHLGWLKRDLRQYVDFAAAVNSRGDALALCGDTGAIESGGGANLLEVWSLKSKRRVLRLSARQLMRRGLRVSNHETYDHYVQFAPSGNRVYAVFPEEFPEDGERPPVAYADPVTVTVDYRTGTARYVGPGCPVGFDGEGLIRFLPSTQTFLGKRVKVHVDGGYFSSMRGNFVVASMGDAGVALQFGSFSRSKSLRRLLLPSKPNDFALLGVCLLHG